MVGLVLVSHSRKLAESVRELIWQMTGPDFPVAVASGAGEDHEKLGTDAVHIADVLKSLSRPEGILVLMDLGSAVLSAEAALELLDHSSEQKIRLSAAPLVEGAIAAAVQANAGGSLDAVAREAERGVVDKQEQLTPEGVSTSPLEISSPPNSAGEAAELVLTVENEHGLHARPAATLVRTVSKFASSILITNLTPAKGRYLRVVSQVLRCCKSVKVIGSSFSLVAMIEALCCRQFAILPGVGLESRFTRLPSSCLPPQSGAPSSSIGGSHTRGSPGSDGIAIGELSLLETSMLVPDSTASGDPAVELEKLDAAMKEVAFQLSRETQSASSSTAALAQSAEILEAQSLILSDPVVRERLKSKLEKTHSSSACAWTSVTEELAAQYQSMDDAYLQGRAADVRDIERRVLHKLSGTALSDAIQLDRPGILYTRELLPSEAAGCDTATVLGVITGAGSATAHSTIIMRTLGIPMVVGAVGIDETAVGKKVAMDGGTGEIWIEPDQQTVATLEKRKRAQLERAQQALAARSRRSVTLDGVRMEILANVGSAADAHTAADNGAEGVGLLRTEFLFLQRSDAPSEEEQERTLRDIYVSISGPIIVRTLDVGADKPLPFLPQREEHNPYLGLRGIRLSLQSPELFLPHLRAILAAGVKHDLWLMFPMVSSVSEVQAALQMLEQAHRELVSLGRPHAWPIKRGAMVEVPSAALMSEELAEQLDFFSIGTNDLTQYVMAAERGNASVTELQDALLPAVLRLMKIVVEGARPRGRRVSICGDAASDPASAAIFAGLGIHSLSVRPKQVAEIKALFRDLKMAHLQQLAGESLRCRDAVEVRKLAKDYLCAGASARRDF